jgi:hypothetical protein
MDSNNKAATYARAPETRGKHAPYKEKFAGLIQLCSSADRSRFQNIVVTWPWVIGDTYEEIIESLARIADAGLVLHILERGDNAQVFVPGIEQN